MVGSRVSHFRLCSSFYRVEKVFKNQFDLKEDKYIHDHFWSWRSLITMNSICPTFETILNVSCFDQF